MFTVFLLQDSTECLPPNWEVPAVLCSAWKGLCNAYKTLRFSWKASELRLSELHGFVSLFALRLGNSSCRSLQYTQSRLLSWPLIFPKALSSQSSVSNMKPKVWEWFIFTYSIILLKYDLLKTCTKPHEDGTVNEKQFLILHCLKSATQPNMTGSWWVFCFSAAECLRDQFTAWFWC